MNGRSISKYAATKFLLFWTRNVVAAEEEMCQFSDLIKMSLSAHEEYNALLEDEASVKDTTGSMRLTTRYFLLRGKQHAGQKMLSKRINQKVHRNVAEPQD